MEGGSDRTVLRLRDGDRGGRPFCRRVRVDALIDDLAGSLGVDPGVGLLIDGRVGRPHDRLDEAGVCQGSVVRRLDPAGGRRTGSAAPARLALVVRDGLDAGRRLPLRSGVWVIGRAAACDLVLGDPAVHELHAAVVVTPEGDATLSWLTGTDAGEERLQPGRCLRVGRTELWVVPMDPGVVPAGLDPVLDRTARATLVVNRPPRPTLVEPTVAPVVPEPPAPARPVPLALAGIVVPVLVAGALVAVTGSWTFALLTLLSPLLALSAWLSNRRSARRDRRGRGRRYAEDLARFSADLQAMRAVHDAGVARRSIDLADLVGRVEGPAAALWERRTGGADAAVVRLGRAELPWWPAGLPALVAERRALHPDVIACVQQAGVARLAPVEVDLGSHRVVGVVGDRAAALAVARSVLAQLVVHHGPADLALVAVAGPPCRADWAWTDWLPHRLGPRAGEPAVHDVLRAALEARRAPASGPARRPADADGRSLLLVVDDEAALGGRASAVRAALRGEAGPLLAIVVAPSADRLPATCRVVVAVASDGAAELVSMHDGSTVAAIEVMGAPEDVAAGIAAGLARFEDPELELPEVGMPSEVGLLELLRVGGLLDAAGTERDDGLDDRGAGTDPDDRYGRGGDRDDGDSLARAVRHRWTALLTGGTGVGQAVPIGLGVDGPVLVDLVADGPHALVAGTTGAGKSELLRSWIAALAVAFPPTLLNVVLVDFKGGSAFDACAELPHTVAVVSDLDGDLTARVLRCLQAELRRREEILRRHGASDLDEILARVTAPRPVAGEAAPGPVPPLARLLVVIDEFAALAAEHPDLLDALVGIAQRGRSLGVHLVLATQRPSGVVNDQIRANTNVRIALRVQDRADSADVIERPDAADLDRRVPGRALVRLGRQDVHLVQSAYSSGVAEFDDGPAVQRLDAADGPGVRRASGPTDLARIVTATQQAAAHLGLPPSRRPWPNPLPERLDQAALAAAVAASAETGAVAVDGAAAAGREGGGRNGGGRNGRGTPSPGAPIGFYLVDDPDRQRQDVGGWDPAQGNLLVFGAPGSGTTGALIALAMVAARCHPPERMHLHVLGDDPALGRLAALPHVGAVVGRADTERRMRLLWRFDRELARRRARAGSVVDAAAEPAVVLLVDGLGSLLAELQGGGPSGEDAERLTRLLAEGPSHGLYTVGTLEHAAAIRHGIAASIRQRLVLRLVDPLDARSLGVEPVAGPPGRGREATTGRLIQVLDPAALLAEIAEVAEIAEIAGPAAATTAAMASSGPWRIGRLPDTVDAADLLGSAPRSAAAPVDVAAGPDAAARTGGWLPVGLGGPGLTVQGWWLHPGEGALVAGPPRSGRSSTLLLVAAQVRRLHPGATVVAVTPRPSPLRRLPGIGHVPGRELDPASLPTPARGDGAPAVLLVDDAEQVSDPGGVVADALAAGWIVVAAGRADVLRGAFGHWTRGLRTSRNGLLLQPDPDLDGELLGVRLPRRAEASLRPPGRGFLVDDGLVSLVQVAVVPDL